MLNNNNNYINNTNNTNNNINTTTTTNSGFSLIELSIVLIIIGLLVIGVVRGYALMSASKIVTLTNELTRYSFAAEQFNAKYGNLPGIIDNPTKLFGSKAKYKIDEDKTDPYAINESGEITNAESINFFNHLALSKLIDGDETLYVGTDNNLSNRNDITKQSKYYPTVKALKNTFIYVRGDSIDGNYNKINRLTIAHYTNSKFGINADLLQGLDSKVDDGLPLSGLISIIPTVLLNDDTNTDNNTSTDAKVNINNTITPNNRIIADNRLIASAVVYNNSIDSNSIDSNSIDSNSIDSINSINSIINYYLSSIVLNNITLINNVNATEVSSNTKDACIVLNKETNTIEYNKKGKNCFLLKSIDSTKRNILTDLGTENITGKPCTLDRTYDDLYPNTEKLYGITMLNGTTRKVNCNTGYSGNIVLSCNNGTINHSGDDKCTFIGCKKYDNGDIINESLNSIINNTNTNTNTIKWDDVDEESEKNKILNNNKDKIYSKGDIIDTLSCIEKTGYELIQDSSNGYTLKCDGNDNIIVEGNGCIYNANTCSVSNLTEEILGNNYVKTISQCNNESCSSTQTDSSIDITLEENKSKIYDYNTYITINTCNTGYSTPNKRIIRCNENGEWVVKDGTENNMCSFTGCNDMSAVFDKNDNKVSSQLYKMQFAISDTRIYPILYCSKNITDINSVQEIADKNNVFVVDSGETVACANNPDATQGGITSESRHYTCTQDTKGKNEGKSYWKVNYASCDLNKIKDKGYTVYLAGGTEGTYENFADVKDSITLTIDTKKTQERIIANQWGTDTTNGGVYTSQHGNFRLICNSSGNWEMTKTANSCSGVPTLTDGGKLYKSDTNIVYVSNQSGMLMNKSTLSKDTSTLTKTILSNTSQYFVTNGTKIEASCNTGYTEVDKNGKVSGEDVDTGGHYYECVNGSWTARGGCENSSVEIIYYSPRLYDDVGKSGKIAATKHFDYGSSITCDFNTFGISDPDSSVIKICSYVDKNGNIYRLAKDNDTFRVKAVSSHQISACFGAYIPRDLGGVWNGEVIANGVCSGGDNVIITKNTYATDSTARLLSDGKSFDLPDWENAPGTATAKGSLKCNNGKWEIGSGSMTFSHAKSTDRMFCVPSGAKSAGKSIKFELWGAQGGGGVGARGGFTRGTMVSSNYSDKDKFYVVTGGREDGDNNSGGSYNGGGAGGSGCGGNNGRGSAGGGATHIATESGLLSSFSGNKDKVLLVAGGAGGNAEGCSDNTNIGGGGGGGNKAGLNGKGENDNAGIGGTTTAGGSSSTATNAVAGSFGQGGSKPRVSTETGVYCPGGGGGGYYGGSSGEWAKSCTAVGSGGGGSGYCKTSKFTCEGWVHSNDKTGSGSVVISW